MSKKEIAFKVLDEMVLKLNGEKQRLAILVRTGQLTNAERHEKFNQFYVNTLSDVSRSEVAQTITGNVTSEEYMRGYNTGYQTASRKS